MGYYWEWLLDEWSNLNWKENKDIGIRWQYSLKVDDITQSGTELRTKGIGGGGGGGRGWKTGLLLILKENVLLSYTCYWPKWYLFCIPGLKCYISFNCCRHTVFINKSLNQEDDSVSSSNKVLLHTTMKHFPTLSYIACSRLPSRAYIFARLSLTRDPYYLIA